MEPGLNSSFQGTTDDDFSNQSFHKSKTNEFKYNSNSQNKKTTEKFTKISFMKDLLFHKNEILNNNFRTTRDYFSIEDLSIPILKKKLEERNNN